MKKIKGAMKMNVAQVYLKTSIQNFESTKKLGDKTFQQLSEEDIQWTFNDTSNSVAVIVKHMSGNMISRWTDFLTTDGEKPNRQRDQEFEATITTKQELLEVWEKGWALLFATLQSLTEDDLLKEVVIRGECHLVLEAIERQVAHYALHVGQLAYIGKQLKGEEWESLSIPKGQSEEFLQRMLQK